VGVFGGQIGTGTGCFPGFSVLPCLIIPPVLLAHLFHELNYAILSQELTALFNHTLQIFACLNGVKSQTT
jgi:hypothetical protein